MKNSKTFRLFISSTFNDFREERKILQTKVFPEIKEYCTIKGYTFQPIDLRWGINEEAQLDQKTLELCLEEVRTCKAYPHPNFLVMLGDRYGWIPLPYDIEQNEFEEITKHITNEEKKLLLEWYQLDKNQLPASYILKHREDRFKDAKIWNKIEKTILIILQKAVEKSSLTTEQKRKYFTSATENEIIEGIIPYDFVTNNQDKLINNNIKLKEIDTKNVFAFIRNVNPKSKISDFFIGNDVKQAQKVKNKIRKLLPKNNIYEVTTSQISKNKLDISYNKEFVETLTNFLINRIDKQIKQENLLDKKKLKEFEQEKHAKNLSKVFFGRKEILNKITEYIERKDNRIFVLYGKHKIGKSSIIAKYVTDYKKNNVEYKYHFAGISQNTTSISDIFEIITKKNIPEYSDNPNFNYEKQCLYIKNEIFIKDTKNNKKTVIFIDALELIEKGKIPLWVPETLPPNLKLIVSFSSNGIQGNEIYDFLNKRSNIFVKVGDFKHPKELILKLLEKENRTLQKQQIEYFLEKFNFTRSPFYVFLAAHELKHYKSFEVFNNQSKVLKKNEKQMLKLFIDNISRKRHHNKDFVYRVLLLLHKSKFGLSESELLDYLNLDKDFIKKIVKENFHKNITDEFPIVHWSRLFKEIKPFLNYNFIDGKITINIKHSLLKAIIEEKQNYKSEFRNLLKVVREKIKINNIFFEYENNPDKINYELDKIDYRRSTHILIYFYTEYFTKFQIKNVKEKKIYKELIEFFNELPGLYFFRFMLIFSEFRFSKIDIEDFKNYLKINFKDFFVAKIVYDTMKYKINNYKWVKIDLEKFYKIDKTFKHRDNFNNVICLYKNPALNIFITKSKKENEKELFKLFEKIIEIEDFYLLYYKAGKRIAQYYRFHNNSLKGIQILKEIEANIYKNEKKFNDKILYKELYSQITMEISRNYFEINNLIESFNYAKMAISQYENYDLNHAKIKLFIGQMFDSYQFLATLFNLNSIYNQSLHLYHYLIPFIHKYFEKLMNSYPLTIASLYNNLLRCYAETGKNDNRLNSIIEEGSQIMTILYKRNSIKYAKVVGSFLVHAKTIKSKIKIEKIEDEKKQLIKEYNFVKKLYQSNKNYWKYSFQRSLRELANIYEYLKDYDNVLKIMEELFYTDKEKYLLDYIDSIEMLVYEYLKKNHIKQAILQQKKAVAILKEAYTKKNIKWREDYSDSLLDLANIYSISNEVEKVIEFSNLCLNIKKSLYYANKSKFQLDYQSALNKIISLYQKHNISIQPLLIELKNINNE